MRKTYYEEHARAIRKENDNLQIYLHRLGQAVATMELGFKDTTTKLQGEYQKVQEEYYQQSEGAMAYLESKPDKLNQTQWALNAMHQNPQKKAPPRPERLSDEATPHEYEDWKDRFMAFSKFYNANTDTLENQKRMDQNVSQFYIGRHDHQ